MIVKYHEKSESPWRKNWLRWVISNSWYDLDLDARVSKHQIFCCSLRDTGNETCLLPACCRKPQTWTKVKCLMVSAQQKRPWKYIIINSQKDPQVFFCLGVDHNKNDPSVQKSRQVSRHCDVLLPQLGGGSTRSFDFSEKTLGSRNEDKLNQLHNKLKRRQWCGDERLSRQQLIWRQGLHGRVCVVYRPTQTTGSFWMAL